MAGNTTNISIRMDADLKAQADALFNELGMNLTTAFNIFVRQSLREGGIPFESQEAKRRLSTWRFSRSARMADKILAITVLHQIIICPPDRGGKNQHKAQHEKGFIDSAKNKQKTYRYAMGFCPLGIYMVCLLPYFIVAVQFFET